ncbi:MAG: aminotransferase class V-fold PLP-dependent enzyme [Solobacterium sp.]|nr:aminotransferase class V-fold PLP-dependent enzyme [Solobacterium sp.]
MNWENERKRFPAALTQVYLETGGTGLIPDYVYEGIKHFQDGRYLRGGDADWGGIGTVQMMSESREHIARMLNCRKEDVFFGSNTSQILSIVFGGYPFQPGDNIVTSAWTFFAQKYAFSFLEKEGVQIRYVTPEKGRITLAMLQEKTDARTRMICLDFVENSTGFQINAKAIGAFCREHGICFVVDACQGTGAMPLDMYDMKIDFLANNDYKWMMNYCGTGFGFVTAELRNRLSQRTCGWMSDKDLFVEKETIELREDAARFEFGYPNVSGIYGLGLVAKRYCELGGKNIEDYILDLNAYLEARVREIPGAHFWSDYERANRSGIVVVCFDHEIDRQKLADRQIVAPVRSGAMYGYPAAMRIGLHYYNNREDIDRLIEALAD